MDINVKHFHELSTDELYEVLKLRCNVFVVEQVCAYADLDEKDRHPETLHLMFYAKDKQLIAYSRVLPPELSYSQPSIGRVVVDSMHRQKGYAKQLVLKSIAVIRRLWPDQDIQIGAQEYLRPFYQSLEFEINSEMYLEDDIPHRDMLLKN